MNLTPIIAEDERRNIDHDDGTRNGGSDPTFKEERVDRTHPSLRNGLFLLVDGIMKIIQLAPVLESHAHLEIPIHLTVGIGILELLCVAVYLFPPTAFLGAILLTSYLGGATALLVRAGDPFIFPVIVGVLIWMGLLLNDAGLRALVPIRR